MIDFHSHILPGMDDGSRNTRESVAMLHLLRQQCVSRVVATPHFYGNQNDPGTFLQRRAASWSRLREQLDEECPAVYLGAEVCYFEGIGRNVDISELCIEGTDILLLEMPFFTWSTRMVDEVLRLWETMNLTVVIAHVERYLFHQSKEIRDIILNSPLLLQANADYFLEWKTQRRALRQLREGTIHLLGTDCHGLERRPPRMDEAVEHIRRHLGREALEQLENRAAMLLSGSER